MKKEYKFSEEHRRKLSLSHLGLPSNWKGKKHTEETKKKISLNRGTPVLSEEGRRRLSLAKLGKKMSEESKLKMGESRKKMKVDRGYINSPETRLKMSLAAKKRPCPMKGKKHSLESLKKMSIAQTGKKRNDETKLKMSIAQKLIGNKPPSSLGLKRTKETKLKMSIGMKGNKHWLGKKHSEEARRKIGLAHSKERCTFWQGGISSLQQILRQSFEYKLWRTRVFERDNYTCKECNQRGGELNADHIKAFSLILRENNIQILEQAISCPELWSLENGRTLCVPCHRKTDTYGSKSIINSFIRIKSI